MTASGRPSRPNTAARCVSPAAASAAPIPKVRPSCAVGRRCSALRGTRRGTSDVTARPGAAWLPVGRTRAGPEKVGDSPQDPADGASRPLGIVDPVQGLLAFGGVVVDRFVAFLGAHIESPLYRSAG